MVKDRQLLHRETRSARCLSSVLRASTDSTETDPTPNPIVKDTEETDQPSAGDADQPSKETGSLNSGGQVGAVAARRPRKRLEELEAGLVLDGIVVRLCGLLVCIIELWGRRKTWSAMDALLMQIVSWMSLCTSLTLRFVHRACMAYRRDLFAGLLRKGSKGLCQAWSEGQIAVDRGWLTVERLAEESQRFQTSGKRDV